MKKEKRELILDGVNYFAEVEIVENKDKNNLIKIIQCSLFL